MTAAVASNFDLSDDDIECFMEYGYCRIKSAFDKDTAHACKEDLWSRLTKEHNIDRESAELWPQKLPIAESYGIEHGKPWSEVFTPKLMNNLDKFCGTDNTDPFGCGWWMITFPQVNSNEKWGAVGSWHIDGQWYTHFPYSREVALTPIMYFSDVKENGGGTAVAEGSHKTAAKMLCQAGLRGIDSNVLSKMVLESGETFNIIEATGEPGDVILMHPLLVHARSSNLSHIDPSNVSAGVRFMCHPGVSLKKDMDYGQDVNTMNLIEISHILAVADCSWQDWKDFVANIASNSSNNCTSSSSESHIVEPAIPHNGTPGADTVTARRQRIHQAIRDLRGITPNAVKEFEDNKKRKADDEGLQLSAEGVAAHPALDEMNEMLGFTAFKCPKY